MPITLDAKDIAKFVRQFPLLVLCLGMISALALSGYAVYETRTSRALGDWELRTINEPYEALQAGFVIVRTYGANQVSDRDFEIFVSDDRASLLLEDHSRARGQMWDSAITPVPQGHWWFVSESNRGGMIRVFWIPLD